MPRTLAAVSMILLPFLLCACAGREPSRPTWRGGWTSTRDVDKIIAAATELEFNALIFGGSKESMKDLSTRLRIVGIQSYWWFSLTTRAPEMKDFHQAMGPEEEKALAEINADKDPLKHGYQWGGEPLPDRLDVLQSRLLCFHRPEVVEWTKAQVRAMLAACPELTGIALDYFGYQNYRCCRCAVSTKLFENALAAGGPLAELPREAALDAFSRDTLVAFTNEIADYIRSVRPSAKVAIHVYPVFLPEPLYGRRLKVDYCCQTAAWFFQPYWSDEKVRGYARTIATETNPDYPDYQGIPFVGVYVGRPYADKGAERLHREVSLIRAATGAGSLSVCSFNDFALTPALKQAAKEALR